MSINFHLQQHGLLFGSYLSIWAVHCVYCICADESYGFIVLSTHKEIIYKEQNARMAQNKIRRFSALYGIRLQSTLTFHFR